MINIIEYLYNFLGFYYILSTLISLFLLFLSLFPIVKYLRIYPIIESLDKITTNIFPPISILVPAYNEESSIVDSVKSLLSLRYPKYEIIIINDGSTDKTLNELFLAFAFEEDVVVFDSSLSSSKVQASYRSKNHPNLVLVHKKNSGKADSLNVGIGHSTHELILAVDADCVLDENSLLRISFPFVLNPLSTVATGGSVKIVNGSKIKHSRVAEVLMPEKTLERIQVIEYIRAFMFGRLGWKMLNSVMIISGAFGLFKKELLLKIGGYRKGCIGEDMDLVLRIHRYCRSLKKEYLIDFMIDPICWTEAPDSLIVLGRQRDRWQRGLADVLWKNRQIFGNPQYGLLGIFAYPYFVFFEFLGPLFEFLAYLTLTLATFYKILPLDAFLFLMLLSFFCNLLISLLSVLLEEIVLHQYRKPNDLLILVYTSFIETFGYHQINLYWRIKGIYSFLKGHEAWGTQVRKGFKKV